MDQCFQYGFFELWEELEKAFPLSLKCVFCKERWREQFNLTEGNHEHIFIIHYELNILKNRNRFTDIYPLPCQGNADEGGRDNGWLLAVPYPLKWHVFLPSVSSGFLWSCSWDSPPSITGFASVRRPTGWIWNSRRANETVKQTHILSFGRASEITISSDFKTRWQRKDNSVHPTQNNAEAD